MPVIFHAKIAAVNASGSFIAAHAKRFQLTPCIVNSDEGYQRNIGARPKGR